MPALRGLGYRFARILSAAACGTLAAALPLSAQPAFVRNAAAPAFPADNSWGLSFTSTGPSLACGKDNTLFVANGDSLYLAADGGRVWSRVAHVATHSFGQHAALAVGSNGLVIWGDAVSKDRGRTWSTAGQSSPGWSTALSILPNGNAVAGSSYDFISMSADSGRTWDRVHLGSSFGHIVSITPAADGWAFAAPLVAPLLISKDNGKTWADSGLVPGEKSLYAGFLATEPEGRGVWAYSQPDWGNSSMLEFHWHAGGLTLAKHAIGASFPESTLTALAVSSPDSPNGQTLWISTWGQGVYASNDKGVTWTARNGGLKDLHVQALMVGIDGVVHALTKDGFYSLAASTAIRPAPGARSSRARLWLGNGSEVANPDGNLFRADGRLAPPHLMKGKD